MIAALTDALVPIFAGLLLGYLAGRWKFVDNQNVRTLITFVMSIALPCSLFSAVDHLTPTVLGQQGQLAFVITITYLVIFVLVYFCGIRWAKLTPGGSAVLALTLAFPNLAAVGFPLLEAIHGPASNVAVAVALAIGAITVSPITLAILENGAGQKNGTTSKYLVVQSFTKTFRKSVVWAPLLGIVFACCSINLPKPLDLSLRTTGSATTGSALFLTGLVVSAQAFKLDRAVLLSVVGQEYHSTSFLLTIGHGHRHAAPTTRLRRLD